MQVATPEEVPSPAAVPYVEPTARRHVATRIVVCLVSLLALAAITIGVVSHEGTPRPVTPNPAGVGGGDPANSPVVPFSVDGSAGFDGTSSADG
jgi:hypothetical protein